MLRRCIMIVPEFANVGAIEGLRKCFDPLHGIVPPHITLVFPFDSELTKDQVERHLRHVLAGISPFRLSLQGISGEEEAWANYLFLNVVEGIESVLRMGRALYTDILLDFRPALYAKAYVPHMTVGKLPKSGDFAEALARVQKTGERFSAMVDSVCVEIIGEGESSTIETIVPLGAPAAT